MNPHDRTPAAWTDIRHNVLEAALTRAQIPFELQGSWDQPASASYRLTDPGGAEWTASALPNHLVPGGAPHRRWYLSSGQRLKSASGVSASRIVALLSEYQPDDAATPDPSS
ncbi:hypothetical protein OOK44_36160 [Streptomyces cellulosae]|uniref:Uncharacterized protein n=1 Tax=Streptomyces althioticus TaxID=83380 RepID=A0ABZ1YFL2_9ACTN|nr:hypothetical protein [Streptomyces cellulosae]WTB86624.1 hypothetical protein OG837_35710 [Streptomyces cellulosae]WTB93438.1 hypothetical protein OIE99_34910 [Streptomyces cellulosae]WTC60829.1 hypothetical protein OH715_36660 [Streptomyces cellulosae]